MDFDLLLVGSFLFLFFMFCIYAISERKKELHEADKQKIKDPLEKAVARFGIGVSAYFLCAAFSFIMFFFFNTDVFFRLFLIMPGDLLFGAGSWPLIGFFIGIIWSIIGYFHDKKLGKYKHEI